MDYPSPRNEVRYIVCQLGDPGDLEGRREMIGWHSELGLAINHANRIGLGTCVDAEGGTYHPGGPGRRSGRWEVEWINRDVYRGKAGRRSADPETAP